MYQILSSVNTRSCHTRLKMGITRQATHKRRKTGGKKVEMGHGKRKYDLGRAPANTKLSPDHRAHEIRCRGGATKFRALRMHTGNYSWPGEGTRTTGAARGGGCGARAGAAAGAGESGAGLVADPGVCWGGAGLRLCCLQRSPRRRVSSR
jgi:small subunit ribosomal protein S8e